MGKKGGSQTTTNTYDPVASQKLTEIAEAEFNISKRLLEAVEPYFLEYEIGAAKANTELLPYITDASRLTLQEQARDLELNRPVKDALRNRQLKELEMSEPVAEKFYDEALAGVDARSRMNRAGARVSQEFDAGLGAVKRDLARMGVDPADPKYAAVIGDVGGLGRAKAVATAKTAAQDNAETESFNRLGSAMGVIGRATGLPGVASTQGQHQTHFGTDPYGRGMAGLGQAAAATAPLASRVLTSTTKYKEPNSFFGFAGNMLGTLSGSYMGGLGYKWAMK